MAQYTYLNDEKFLKIFDCENHKEQFVRITVLNFKTEEPLASIEGKATGGSCTLSGTSNMRRVASCSLVADPNGINNQYLQYANITEVDNLISLNKKIRLEIGLTNTLKYNYYNQYDMIWYPLGVYVIKNASVSRNNSGVNISLTLNDKCALLNGDMGGTFPADIILSEKVEYDTTNSKMITTKLLLKDLIRYIVVDFGGELPNNVIIEDIDDYAVKVLKWTGKTDLYLYSGKEGEKYFTTIKPDNKTNKEEGVFTYGQDVGYSYTEFVYPGKLECKAGETAATALDKIKNVLGNFEWFYDINGRFHFQMIKNYLNNSFAGELSELTESNYFNEINLTKTAYVFDDSNRILLTSISNAPQYNNIKNDFVVWGARKGAGGSSIPIRYHVAFDTKPEPRKDPLTALVGTDSFGNHTVKVLSEEDIIEGKPSISSDRSKYYQDTVNVWIWDFEYNDFRQLTSAEGKICKLLPSDWRSELYFKGLENANKNFAENYYAAELNAEFPKIYDVLGNFDEIKGVYIGTYKNNNYDYWLDFIEGNQGGSRNLSQFNVSNIGRRTKINNNSKANCLMPANTNTGLILVPADGDTTFERNIAAKKGNEIVQLSPELYKQFSIGGTQNDAFSQIKEMLTQHANYAETVNLSIIPIYHLEPNTRISIADTELDVQGDYLIKSISLPLTFGGTSNISAIRCLEKTI